MRHSPYSPTTNNASPCVLRRSVGDRAAGVVIGTLVQRMQIPPWFALFQEELLYAVNCPARMPGIPAFWHIFQHILMLGVTSRMAVYHVLDGNTCTVCCLRTHGICSFSCNTATPRGSCRPRLRGDQGYVLVLAPVAFLESRSPLQNSPSGKQGSLFCLLPAT